MTLGTKNKKASLLGEAQLAYKEFRTLALSGAVNQPIGRKGGWYMRR